VGKLTYLRASLEAAREYEAKEITLVPDGVQRKLRAVSLAIGNWRYAGSGRLAAPRANPEDGLLDLVVIEDVGVLEVLKLALTMLDDSAYLDREGIFFARAKEIRVEASPGSLEFTVDGEVSGTSPPCSRRYRKP
jgi:diacylglycerol kinase (ATP)